MSDPFAALRRNDFFRATSGEIAIRQAIAAVGGMGADPRLTDAVILLEAAKNSVADFVDDVALGMQPRVYYEPRVRPWGGMR